MARARLLKPGFFTNAKLSQLPPHARLLFAGLWTLADREGRLKDEPLAIKGALFAFEDVDVDDLLKQLARGGFVSRYRAQGEKFVSVNNFLKHQTPHIREAASTIPAPVQHSASTAFSGTSPAVPIAVVETETVSDPVAVDAQPSARRDVFVLYDQYMGKPAITEMIKPVLIEAEEKHGLPCVTHCFEEAARSSDGRRSWNYVNKILERHAREGCDGEFEKPLPFKSRRYVE